MEDGNFFNVRTVSRTHRNKREKRRQPNKGWKSRRSVGEQGEPTGRAEREGAADESANQGRKGLTGLLGEGVSPGVGGQPDVAMWGHRDEGPETGLQQADTAGQEEPHKEPQGQKLILGLLMKAISQNRGGIQGADGPLAQPFARGEDLTAQVKIESCCVPLLPALCPQVPTTCPLLIMYLFLWILLACNIVFVSGMQGNDSLSVSTAE